MGKGYRQGRLGEEIRKIISEMLLREIKDPRLSNFVSVSAVDVSPDGSYASVYINRISADPGEDPQAAEEAALEALRSARGLIRREIGKQLQLRHAPELRFSADRSFEYGRRIETLIDRIQQEKHPGEDNEE